MSINQDIRAALINQVITANGFPGANFRAYDDQIFTPIIGSNWARITYIPNTETPFLDAVHSKHRGMLQVSLHGPVGVGTGALDIMADDLLDVVRPGTSVFANGVRVFIERSQRARAVPVDNSTWLMLPVTVNWRCVATN